MPQTQPIEDHPELRGFLRNSVEWSFTLAMWLLWIYFFLPLISLVLWGFGLVNVYQNLFRWDVLPQLHEVLKMVGVLVVVIFIVLRGWGYYNYYVFGRRNRRKDRKIVSASRHRPPFRTHPGGGLGAPPAARDTMDRAL